MTTDEVNALVSDEEQTAIRAATAQFIAAAKILFNITEWRDTPTHRIIITDAGRLHWQEVVYDNRPLTVN